MPADDIVRRIADRAAISELHAVEEVQEREADRPQAADVTDWRALASDTGEQEYVIRDLIPRGTVILLTGEEGDGKTLLAEQLCRQALREENVWGMFEPGDLPITGVLLVDTEMSTGDTWPRWKEAEERGLAVEPGRFHWLNCGPLDLATEEDRAYVEAELLRTKSNFLWIDAGGSAVADPKDDQWVKAFFAWLLGLIRNGVILAAGVTVHPRKRAQGEFGRRHDDLFGSREWKGKATKTLYLEGAKLVAWKDRGGHLGRRWPAREAGRYPVAVLRRPGLDDPAVPPFIVEAKKPEPEFDAEVARAKALEVVQSKPGHYTKSTLAGALGVRKAEGLDVVSALVREGLLGPDKPRAKLAVAITGGDDLWG